MAAKDVMESAREDLDRWREQARENSYVSDPFIRRLLHCHLGSRWAEADGVLRAVADQAGPRRVRQFTSVKTRLVVAERGCGRKTVQTRGG